MKSKIGEFIMSPAFGKLADDAITKAVAEANAVGLAKAYTGLDFTPQTKENAPKAGEIGQEHQS